ncbi:hypothetical protein TNCV_1001031 [Trichonephila clavipes]|nr:hypothetical protein TNCV_1001031 [Trichonephila clavipes]
MENKDILESVQSSKNIIYADSDGDEMNNPAPNPMSSETRNIFKGMQSYLDTHSNGEMNNKMDGIKQCVDNLTLKNAEKNIIFSKNSINVSFTKP